MMLKAILKDGLGTFSAGRYFNAVQTARGVQTTSQVGKTLSLAAGSFATVVGVPVTAGALGVTGVSQLVKYGYKYKACMA